MREPRTRVEASTRRHENAMKPSPMTEERGGGEWWRRTKVRARGEGSLMGRKGGWQNFLKRSPSCHGLRLREFFRAWKISIALWKIKTSALLVSLPNLDLWKFWKNSLLNIYKSEARIFSLKRNFSFFFTKIFLYIPFVFLSRIIDSRDNYRGIKSRIVGPTGRGSLHKYEDDVRELEHRGHENAMKIALRRRNAV